MLTVFQIQLLVLFGLLAAGGNFFGGWLITRSASDDRPHLKYLLAFGAGFMLAAVLLEVLPQSMASTGSRAMIWVLAGYLIIQFVEHTIAPHFHFGREQHEHEIKMSGAAGAAITALAIHAFFDGVSISSSLLVNARLGVVLFIAVLLHKIPEGFTVASIALAAGRGTSAAIRSTLLIGAATFGGILSATAARDFVGIALPLSAGATLYISATDLIPEINRDGTWRVSIFVFIGVATYALTHVLLESVL
jgi:zinc and cadmium transporter